jgi:GMP synthase-like glutamine amidotransferase
MPDVIALGRTIIRSEVPYFEKYLGMKVLVKAAGGQVTRCMNNEVGPVSDSSRKPDNWNIIEFEGRY